MRLDTELFARGLVKSRTLAQTLIKDGKVFVDGNCVLKPSYEINKGNFLEIKGDLPKYVSRGGSKLEKAIEEFKINLKGCICVDIGASTGGFTDCMLQNGAKLVYAVDVGSDQLDERLKNDSRVVSLEKTDIRNAKIPQKADFISIDVSFISLELIFPSARALLKSGGNAVALIKPQFELNRNALNKRGVVKDEKLREGTVEKIKNAALKAGFDTGKAIRSPITGGDGNTEYLIFLSAR